MLERLALFVIARRWFVVAAWVVVVAFSVFATGKLSDRPSVIKLMGRWNWWFPDQLARVLLVKKQPPPAPASAVD